MLLNVKKYLALAAVVGMTAVFGAGCSSAAKATPAAQAKVAVSTAALVIADVTSIKVTIDDNAVAPLFGPIDLLLTKAPAGNVWTGNITQIPANPAPGSLRRFKAEAFNGATKIYAGDTVATVIAGSTAQVAIILQEVAPAPGTTNYAPAITSLTSTSAYVAPGTVGSSTVVASDPDNNGGTLAIEWSATCTAGSMIFGSPDAATTTWTAPSVNAVCTVAVTVKETATPDPLWVTTYFTITVNANFGDATIAAFPNTFPIVTARSDFRYNFFADVLTIPVGQQADLYFTAFDPDGDNVRFNLSAKCGATLAAAAASADIASTYFSSAVSTTTTGGPVAPPAQSAFAFDPFFGYNGGAPYTNPADDCIFKITVQDLCTGGNCGPVGAQGALADGADKVTTINGVAVTSVTTGFINATHPAQAKRAPVVVRTVAPNQTGSVPAAGVQTWDPKFKAQVQPGTQYLLQAEADDRYENGTLAPTYACANGTFVTGPVHTGNLKTSLLWTSPATLTVGMQCTITFTSSASSLATVATFQFVGSDPCVGAPDGTSCNDGNACTTGETCQAGVCTVPAAGTTTCAAADSCHVAGVCNPLTGACSTPNAPNGTSCNADSNGCTVGDSCQAGTCTAGPPPACIAPPNGYCYASAGTCASTGTTTFTCNYAASSAGTTCTAANAVTGGSTTCSGLDVFPSFACNGAGACAGTGTPAPCPNTTCSTGNQCQPASGLCGGGAPVANNTPCSDGNACTTGDSCQAGLCASGGPTCPTSQSCTPGTGACVASHVVPTRALALRLTPPAGAAIDPSGNTFVVGGISVIAATNFQTRPGGTPAINLKSAGGADAFIGKYDAAGDIAWAFTIQDNASAALTDQAFTLAAVNQGGTVGVIGKFAGTVTFGTTSAGGANPTPIIAAFNGSDGARLWVNGYDLGANGLFQSVAANPSQASNRFAACGFADAAASSLDPAAVFGGVQDAVIGVWNNAGTKLWGRQIGGAAGSNTTENCAAVAIDANGDVLAAGQFDGATLDLGSDAGGTNISLVGPGDGNRKFMWIAKFNGATGVTMAAAVFSGTSGSAVPRSLAIEAGGKIAVAGSFSGNLTIGAPMTSTGSEDGFIAALSSAFAPSWNAVRVGGTALDLVRSVDFTSFGDIVAVGNFAASSAPFRATNGGDTTGAAALTSLGGADVMVLKLNGLTGATDSAAGYGNTGTQSGDTMAVNGLAAANHITFTATSGGSVNFGTATFTAAGVADAAVVFANLQ
jgi:hypothetical protein